jgi:hypothetical protein
MAYSNDARLALTTQTLLPAYHLVSSIEAVTPPGFRQGSSSETSSYLAYHHRCAAHLHFPYRPGRSQIPRHRPLADGSDDRHPRLSLVEFQPQKRDVDRGVAVAHLTRLWCSVLTVCSVQGKASVAPLQSRARRSSDGIRGCGVHHR